MLTEKDYCDKDLSAALKELGYPTKLTLIGEQATIEIPINSGLILLYEAQKWLREKHNLHIEITYSPSCWTGKIYDLKEWDYVKGFTFFESFEDTLHTLIKEAVKILKEK